MRQPAFLQRETTRTGRGTLLGFDSKLRHSDLQANLTPLKVLVEPGGRVWSDAAVGIPRPHGLAAISPKILIIPLIGAQHRWTL